MKDKAKTVKHYHVSAFEVFVRDGRGIGLRPDRSYTVIYLDWVGASRLVKLWRQYSVNKTPFFHLRSPNLSIRFGKSTATFRVVSGDRVVLLTVGLENRVFSDVAKLVTATVSPYVSYNGWLPINRYLEPDDLSDDYYDVFLNKETVLTFRTKDDILKMRPNKLRILGFYRPVECRMTKDVFVDDLK